MRMFGSVGKAAKCKQLTADLVINYKTEPVDVFDAKGDAFAVLAAAGVSIPAWMLGTPAAARAGQAAAAAQVVD
jgi:hypothetical protein